MRLNSGTVQSSTWGKQPVFWLFFSFLAYVLFSTGFGVAIGCSFLVQIGEVSSKGFAQGLSSNFVNKNGGCIGLFVEELDCGRWCENI